MKKEYCIAVKHNSGAVASLKANTDRADYQIQIDYCGRDTGRRFRTIGHAARELEKLSRSAYWAGECDAVYAPASEIPVVGGSEWGKALYRHFFLGEKFPDPHKYYYY